MAFQGYEPSDPPNSADPEVLSRWMADQLRQIAGTLAALHFGRDKMQYTAPKQVYDGLIVLADGTSWNPGSGKGYYGYYTGAWHFLG